MQKQNNLLQQQVIDKGCNLLIDPDNVFWALRLGKDRAGPVDEKIFSLYAQFKSKLDVAMEHFRFRVDLNSVYINPTDICNASCPYCYIPASIRKTGTSLTCGELIYILEKIEKYFYRNDKTPGFKPIIIYHASEPLLVKDMLFSSIERFSRRFHFGIQTNATLLEKKDVKFLKSHKVSVGVSLDSFDAKTNDRTRKTHGYVSCAKAIQAIEWFDGYEGLNVITTITKHNVRSLVPLVRFVHSKRVPCLLLNPVRATRKEVVGLRPTQKELTRYFIEAVKEALRVSKESGRHIIIGNFSNIVLGIVAPQARRLMCDISPCGGGRCFLAITAHGDMIPCGEFIGFKEFYGGNIFNSSLSKAITSGPFKRIRRRIVEKIADCKSCIYRNICGAPCPAEVYALNNNLNVPSPYCEFYKEIIRFAFQLIAEGKIKYLFRKNALGGITFEYNLNR